MSQIAKYGCEVLGGAEISCIIVKGEPQFNSVEVATMLGCKRSHDALFDHAPLKFKNNLSLLLRVSKVCVSQTFDVSELNSACQTVQART